MDKSKRKTIRYALSKKLFIEKDKSRTIEISIYELAKRLHQETQEPLEDLYCKFAYEKLGEIFLFPDKIENIIQNINDRVLGWDSFVYSEWKEKELSRVSERAQGVRMAEGEFKCIDVKCASLICFYYQEQRRSLDEPASTFVVCTRCGGRYSFN